MSAPVPTKVSHYAIVTRKRHSTGCFKETGGFRGTSPDLPIHPEQPFPAVQG